MSIPSVVHSDFLPATHPALPDLQSCEEWLTTARMGDSRQACTALINQISELEIAPPRQAIYQQILERMRPLALSALEENSKRFSGKALPLLFAEESALQQAFDLCDVLSRSYRRLLRAATRTQPQSASARAPGTEIALLAARTIEFAALRISFCYRARHEAGTGTWRNLYQSFALAETLGVTDVNIAHSTTHHARLETCTSLFVQPLLLALAHPYGLPSRETHWIAAWLKKWGSKVRITKPDSATHVSASSRSHEFDIDASEPPHRMDARSASGGALSAKQATAGMRILDTTELRRSLRRRIHALEEGKTPVEIGLGIDCVQPAAAEVLHSLLNAWGNASSIQRFPRRPVASAGVTVEGAVGIVAVHALVSGKPFESEVRVWDYTRRGTAYLPVEGGTASSATFSGISAHQYEIGPDPAAVTEAWNLIDESAGGFRLSRAATGSRVALRQLLAIRPRGAAQFILSEVRWLRQDLDRSIMMGTQALPGMPTPCAARPTAADPSRPTPFVPAFILSVGRSLPSTLVLPANAFQTDRALELRVEGSLVRVRLTGLAARGHDYDRATFATMT